MANTNADNYINPKTNRISAGVLQSVATLLIRYAKQTITASKTLKKKSKIPPKKLISSIGNKAIKLCHRRKNAEEEGDDGVWRREILMGDKCQPLDFSGVIYYDKDGNILTELPMRSPRASPRRNMLVLRRSPVG
ncbi:hypothetical protein R6Q59_023348 [Mikania micrantha]|uniref:Uncharacterized protein n=1 Tax=Mikania micrantha TaxID=192012 RepID=A0A5N6PB13_9ASTR|nr:hypothetical protein E3N88_10514 [Mikania micrantha]